MPHPAIVRQQNHILGHRLGSGASLESASSSQSRTCVSSRSLTEKAGLDRGDHVGVFFVPLRRHPDLSPHGPIQPRNWDFFDFGFNGGKPGNLPPVRYGDDLRSVLNLAEVISEVTPDLVGIDRLFGDRVHFRSSWSMSA